VIRRASQEGSKEDLQDKPSAS